MKRIKYYTPEQLKKECEKNTLIIKNAKSCLDECDLRNLYEEYWGPLQNYQGKLMIKKGEVVNLTVPSVWRKTNEVNLPDDLRDYTQSLNDPIFNSVFPIEYTNDMKFVTTQIKWLKDLLQRKMPGTRGYGYTSEKMMYISESEFYGKSLDATVWDMLDECKLSDLRTKYGLISESIVDTGEDIVLSELTRLPDPYYLQLLRLNPDDVNQRIVNKGIFEFNCVNTVTDSLAHLEKNKIEVMKYCNKEVDILLISPMSSTIIREKKEHTVYYFNGGLDGGTQQLGFGNRPDLEIVKIGTTQVKIQEPKNNVNFETDGLKNRLHVGETLIVKAYFIDKKCDSENYCTDDMSPSIGDFLSGEKKKINFDDICEKLSPFGDNGYINTKDGSLVGDFLIKSDGTAIDYQGDMRDNKENGCTTKYFAKLASTLRDSMLKSIGMTSDEEIKLLTQVGYFLEYLSSIKTLTGNALKNEIIKNYNDGTITFIDTSSSIFGIYSYERMKTWSNLIVVNDTLKEYRDIAKKYIKYLENVFSFINAVYGDNNLLMEKGNDEEANNNRERWINRVFFTRNYWVNYNGNIYPILPSQTVGYNVDDEIQKNNIKYKKDLTTSQPILQFNDSYIVKGNDLIIPGIDVITGELANHINDIHKYASINTSLGPLMYTYLCGEYNKVVLDNYNKYNIARPDAFYLIRIDSMDTENGYYVKRGTTLQRVQGDVEVLTDSDIHGNIRWDMTIKLGIKSKDPLCLYKANNIRLKKFDAGCGSEFSNLTGWEGNNDSNENLEEEFVLKTREGDGSLFGYVIPPESTVNLNQRFSFQTENIFNPKDNKKMLGKQRFQQIFGKFSKWEADKHDINRLFFNMAAEFKKGKEIHRIKGELLNDIEEGNIIRLTGTNYSTKY